LVINKGILPLESTLLLYATLLNNRSVRAEVRYGKRGKLATAKSTAYK
jgi:hypothetical protein